MSYEKAHGRTAGVVMTRNVVTVDADTPLNEIARLLEYRHIKRVPVLSDGNLRVLSAAPTCCMDLPTR